MVIYPATYPIPYSQQNNIYYIDISHPQILRAQVPMLVPSPSHKAHPAAFPTSSPKAQVVDQSSRSTLISQFVVCSCDAILTRKGSEKRRCQK